MSRLSTYALLLTVAMTLTACSGQSGAKSSSDSPSSKPVDHPCPTSGAAGAWPTGVPAAMPRPAGLHVVSHQSNGGIAITRFTTTQSLVELAGTFRAELRKAGFDLRGGDAEGDEVDQRFGGHGYRGALKLHGSSACRTDGTLVGARLRQSG